MKWIDGQEGVGIFSRLSVTTISGRNGIFLYNPNGDRFRKVPNHCL